MKTMKSIFVHALAAGMIAVGAVACSDSEKMKEEKEEVKETVDAVEQDVKEAANKVEQKAETASLKVENYVYEQKEELVGEANKAIVAADKRIEALETEFAAQADDVTDELKEERRDAIDEAKRYRNELKKNMEKMEESGEEAWDEVKLAFNDALKETRQKIDEAENAFE